MDSNKTAGEEARRQLHKNTIHNIYDYLKDHHRICKDHNSVERLENEFQ